MEARNKKEKKREKTTFRDNKIITRENSKSQGIIVSHMQTFYYIRRFKQRRVDTLGHQGVARRGGTERSDPPRLPPSPAGHSSILPQLMVSLREVLTGMSPKASPPRTTLHPNGNTLWSEIARRTLPAGKPRLTPIGSHRRTLPTGSSPGLALPVKEPKVPMTSSDDQKWGTVLSAGLFNILLWASRVGPTRR